MTAMSVSRQATVTISYAASRARQAWREDRQTMRQYSSGCRQLSEAHVRGEQGRGSYGREEPLGLSRAVEYGPTAPPPRHSSVKMAERHRNQRDLQ